MDKDPFFDEDSQELDPLPEDLWVVEVKPPKGEISLSEGARHEWEQTDGGPDLAHSDPSSVMLVRSVDSVGRIKVPPMHKYRCRRCGLESACLPWEDPTEDDGTEYLRDTCTDLMISNTHSE